MDETGRPSLSSMDPEPRRVVDQNGVVRVLRPTEPAIPAMVLRERLAVAYGKNVDFDWVYTGVGRFRQPRVERDTPATSTA